MSSHRLSKPVAFAVMATLIGVAWLLPPSASAVEECVKMERWLKQHKKTLPRSYDEITRYPSYYQRAIFGVLSPEEKSEVWRTHINFYLENHPELSTEQRDVLLRALDLVSPEFYSLSKRDSAWQEMFAKPIAELKNRARLVFDGESRKAIFSELGRSQSGSLRVIVSHIEAHIKCECSSISDYCDVWGTNGKECMKTTCKVNGGCGDYWGYTCDGMCYPGTPPTE